jgi:hypothetical protein
MALRRVGFFRELDDGEPTSPSIHDAVRSGPHPEAERIVAYLKAGIGLAGVGHYARDVLAPEWRCTVSPGLSTDGVWLWRADLPYYIAKYHVAVPEEFVAHMQQNGWTVPGLSEAEVSRLGKDLYHETGGQ